MAEKPDANKPSLREYQAAVAARLKDAANQTTSAASLLGFVAGDQNWLVDLQQVAEVFPLADLEPVPLAQKYFLGVCNVRGNLYSVVDFCTLNGRVSPKPAAENRLLLLPNSAVQGAALMVTRMMGLRNPVAYKAETPPAGSVPWVGAVMRDAEQIPWHVLNLDVLVHHQKFLNVAA